MNMGVESLSPEASTGGKRKWGRTRNGEDLEKMGRFIWEQTRFVLLPLVSSGRSAECAMDDAPLNVGE